MNKRVIRIVLAVIGLFVLGYILWYSLSIIYYFLIATFIAFLARPLMLILGKIQIKQRKLPEWSKAAIVLLLLLGVLASFISLTIPTIVAQAEIIAEIDASKVITSLEPQLAKIEPLLLKLNIDKEELGIMLQNEFSKLFTISDLGQYANSLLGVLSNAMIAFFSILFISFFLLKDGKIVDNMVSSLTPNNYLDKVKAIIEKTKNLLSRYIVGIVIQILIIMTIITVGLMILNVQNALLIGILAGIFNVIPYLGPLIGGGLGLSLAVTSQLQVSPNLEITNFVLMALIPFVVAQTIDNFVLQPLIFSRSANAHPLEIFIVILVAGNISGFVGMILAVPVYSFVRIVAKEFFNGYKVVQGLTKNL